MKPEVHNAGAQEMERGVVHVELDTLARGHMDSLNPACHNDGTWDIGRLDLRIQAWVDLAREIGSCQWWQDSYCC